MYCGINNHNPSMMIHTNYKSQAIPILVKLLKNTSCKCIFKRRKY